MNTRKDIVLQIGETVLVLQKVEKCLYHCLKATSENADRSLKKLLDGDKATLGQLINGMKNQAVLSNSFEDSLSKFVTKRNKLIHNLSHEDRFDLSNQEGRDAVGKYIFDLLDHAKECLRISTAFLLVSKPQYNPEDFDTKSFLANNIKLSSIELDQIPQEVFERNFEDEVVRKYQPHIKKRI